MEFVYPQFFWVMLVPFVLFAFLVVTNKENVARVFDEKVLARLRAESDSLPNTLRNLVLFAAIFLMIVALSRPVIDRGEKVVSLKGINLLIALDISGSMRSKDLYPNRLEFAKEKIKELLNDLPGDEVALSAFAQHSFVLAPFTSDKATLKQIVEGVNERYINRSATDFLAMADLAGSLLKEKKQKVLLLFTDGGDKESLKGLAQVLKERGITLYAVLVGTKKGAPVLDDEGHPLHTKSGAIAMTRINESLLEVAKETGGGGVVAGYGKEDMKTLAEAIHRKFAGRSQGVVKIHERTELFIYPLAAAALLLLAGLSSMPRSEEKFRFQMHTEKRRRKS